MATNAPTPSSKPALQDDLALYNYLKVARNPVPGALFYGPARKRLLHYEADQGRYGQEVLEAITLAFATFMDQLTRGKVSPPTQRSLWLTFLAYYKAGTGRAYVDGSKHLHATYFARDVLLVAMADDKAKALNAITTGFEEPSRRGINRKYPTGAVVFADVYQDALFALFKKPPEPEKEHTAQLFSIFRTILIFKAADAFRGDRRNDPPPDFTDNVTDDGKNINDFTDHIIETNKLAELFGSDDIGEILRLALDQLQEGCRSLLKLKYFQQLRQREIAEKMGWSTNSVGTRISRCLKKLKDILRGGKT